MYTKSPELNAALFSAVYLSSLEFDDLIVFSINSWCSFNASSIDETITPFDFNSSDKLADITFVPTCINPFSFFTSSTRFERKSGNLELEVVDNETLVGSIRFASVYLL